MSEPAVDDPSRAADRPVDVDDEIESLRSENARLRALVGPLEQSYVDLRRELDDAAAAVRAAEVANGELRAWNAELVLDIDRVRHNLGSLRRLLHQRSRRVVGAATRPVRRRWNALRS